MTDRSTKELEIIAITEKHLGRKLTDPEVRVALAQAARLGLIPCANDLPKSDLMAPRQPADTTRNLVCVAETFVPKRFIVLTRRRFATDLAALP
jgi:hypothetical protein